MKIGLIQNFAIVGVKPIKNIKDKYRKQEIWTIRNCTI